MQRIPASRDNDFAQQQETSNQRDEKSAIDIRWLKETHQKLTEKHNAVQAQLDAQVGAQVRVCFNASRKVTVPKITRSHLFLLFNQQGKIAKQLEDYFLNPFSQFPFPGSQVPFPRDIPKVNLTVPVTTTSSGTGPSSSEVGRESVSPKTVSAAVTLSSMEKARGEEAQWTSRLTPPAKNDARVVSGGNGVMERVKSPRMLPGVESAITKEIGNDKAY